MTVQPAGNRTGSHSTIQSGEDLSGQQSVRHERGKTSAVILRCLVVCLGVIWGLQISLAKIAGEDVGATSAGLLLMHIFLATVFAAFQITKGQWFVPSQREIGFYAVSAVLVNIAPLWLELTIAPHMSAGLLTLISCMSPIMTVVFVLFLRAEHITWQRVLGVLVGVAAVVVVLVPKASIGDAEFGWTMLAFVLPALMAAYGVFMKQAWPRGRTPLQVSTCILIAGTVMLFPIHFATSALPLEEMRSQYASIPLLMLAISIGFEFYLFALLIRLGGAVIASCADYVAVLAGLGWGFILFGERPDTGLWLAVGLCFMALWLICRQREAIR